MLNKQGFAKNKKLRIFSKNLHSNYKRKIMKNYLQNYAKHVLICVAFGFDFDLI